LTELRRVRIRRLSLEGIEPSDRDAVAASFQAELARLLTAYPDRLPDRARPQRDDSPAELGRRAAATVHARVVASC
jgi:hypothetical protein